jgi:transposase InsO family protein
MIEELQTQTGADVRKISTAIGVGYRRLLRWRQRVRAGQPALTSPGPKKAGPLPLAQLKAEIAALSHGLRRSRATLALYARNRDAISRRDLAQLVGQERVRQAQARRQSCKRITWHQPNLAWAIDATERGRDQHGRKLYIHAVQDLCTRYRFKPLPALESKGMAIAEHLDRLFQRHDPPLFLKRDNGSPLNDEAVDAVLARHGVIPLNSPARYPQYNGAMENGIRQIQSALGECLVRPTRWDPDAIAPYLLAVQHNLNCRPRRSLHGHSACEAYHHQPRVRYSQRDRLATFEWIRIHAIDRINQLETVDHRSVLAAWRAAAETWLRCQGLITVSINQKVLPHLPRSYVQH